MLPYCSQILLPQLLFMVKWFSRNRASQSLCIESEKVSEHDIILYI